MESINFEETGGAFGIKRVLATMTIHTHVNGRLYVTDDWDNGRTKSAGHNDLQSVLRMHKMQDDYRTI